MMPAAKVIENLPAMTVTIAVRPEIFTQVRSHFVAIYNGIAQRDNATYGAPAMHQKGAGKGKSVTMPLLANEIASAYDVQIVQATWETNSRDPKLAAPAAHLASGYSRDAVMRATAAAQAAAGDGVTSQGHTGGPQAGHSGAPPFPPAAQTWTPGGPAAAAATGTAPHQWQATGSQDPWAAYMTKGAGKQPG